LHLILAEIFTLFRRIAALFTDAGIADDSGRQGENHGQIAKNTGRTIAKDSIDRCENL
jgi:hypothetical protein